MKDKITEIERARGLSILCVVLIHSTSNSLIEVSTHSLMFPVYLILNRLACFAVPAFIFFSGIVLFIDIRITGVIIKAQRFICNESNMSLFLISSGLSCTTSFTHS
jgi:surface polysaccharide O-acyltransferase-like enzyme